MRRFGFFLGLMIGFFLEVTVDAAESVQLRSLNIENLRKNPLSASLVEAPRLCLTAKASGGPCALRVGAKRKLVHRPSEGREWIMSELTITVRLGEDRLRLLAGALKVNGLQPTTIETGHGFLVVHDQAFLERASGKLTIVNTGTKPVEFRGRGWKESQAIPSGLEAFIDLPDVRSGEASVSLPLPLDFDAQVVREARLFEGDKDSFNRRLEALVELRSAAAIVSAKLHQESVQRQIASTKAREKKFQASRAAREARDKELRALFRRKVLNPQ